MEDLLKSPFPWFGGKRAAAPMVWQLLGDLLQYVEPFAGSLAVLLARSRYDRDHVETVNDLDCMIVNTWRAIRYAPADVAILCTAPVMEAELHARLAYVNEHRTDDFTAWIEGDPAHYDAALAAHWLYATCNSIGYPFDPGPWHTVDGRLIHLADKGRGINRELPHLADKGRGINRELPHLASKGQGILDYLNRLANRLQYTRITCGDWSRCLKPSSIGPSDWNQTGVFLDPPYRNANTKYHTSDENTVSQQVETWCLNAPEDCRIVLAGYDNEHDPLLEHGWTKHQSKPGGSGYNHGANTNRERLWASPACHATPTLF
ncbi:DNA adenine methylase [Bifidobacterium scaligerum]|uniref:site-specific DNA-methyltransferase (adenine-specific) n=1 Tax=Bifidobacterium scaligerum TaxID=2052656 RepID=A0A2M9HT56_9BIFI|nr:DNA adenine methylase [Bifidobacterium scaligerum]PJM79993.1 DNA methyltransferase [Bifidobacterium scaligerum]